MTEPPVVYLDANIFIQALEGGSDTARCCRALMDAIRSGVMRGVTSELTLAEVLVRPVRLRLVELGRTYLALLDGPRSLVDLVPVTRDILVKSVVYRARAHLWMPDPAETRRNFLPDAIHVVSALQAGVSSFAGTDTRIRLPSGIRHVDPRGSDPVSFVERVLRG